MKRLTRWLFNLASVVSAILCLVSATIWVRTWFASDIIERLDSYPSSAQPLFQRQITFAAGGNSLLVERLYLRIPKDWLGRGQPKNEHGFSWERGMPVRGLITAVNWTTRTPAPSNEYLGPLGASLVRSDMPGLPRSIALSLSLWSIMTITAVLPLLVLIRHWRRARRSRIGLCVCGYDLRATPERCPECGAIPNAAEARRT